MNAHSALLGGGETYILNLFANVPQDVEVFIVGPEELLAKIDDQTNLHKFMFNSISKNPIFRSLWEIFILPVWLWRLKIDLVFFPSGLVPPLVFFVRSVVMFRNMLPFSVEDRRRFPLGVKRVRYWLLRRMTIGSFRRASAIIFISEFARSVIKKELSSKADDGAVIYHGISDSFRAKEGSSPTGEEYILYVSILNVYKAQLEVIRAFKRLKEIRHTREKLLLIGPEYPFYGNQVRQLIKDLDLQDEVSYLGKVKYDDLPSYYRGAKVNLFASTCENCPNILLEMLASGRPVFSSNYPPMPEIGGDAPVYFDPYSPDTLANQLADHLDQPLKLAAMAAASAKRSQMFSWDKTRNETWAFLLKKGREVRA